MEILSLRMGGEYSKILNLLQSRFSIKLGVTEDAAQLSPLLRLYGSDLLLLGYTPRIALRSGTFELLGEWDEDLWLAGMPIAMAVGEPFIAEFERQLRQRGEWGDRILPIYPGDFRCAQLGGILNGHVVRYRYRREQRQSYEGDADASFELVSKGDRMAFPWESWFLAPGKSPEA